MIAKMTFDLKMDRKVDNTSHYISPGEYEIMNEYGEIITFDFQDCVWNIDKRNNRIIHVEVENLDIEAFPDSKYITAKMIKNSLFTEFFVFTGDDEPEIHPVKVSNLLIEFDDCDWVVASKAMIDAVNRVLSD